jgi:hypothetical protein
MMKNIKIYILFLGLVGILAGCEKEEVISYPNTPPVLTLEKEEITGKTNQDIVIKGTVEDAFGLKDMIVQSAAINLNRRIAISDNKVDKALGINTTFEFEVKHKVPASVTLKEIDILVKCNNLTGQSTEKIVKLKL